MLPLPVSHQLHQLVMSLPPLACRYRTLIFHGIFASRIGDLLPRGLASDDHLCCSPSLASRLPHSCLPGRVDSLGFPKCGGFLPLAQHRSTCPEDFSGFQEASSETSPFLHVSVALALLLTALSAHPPLTLTPLVFGIISKGRFPHK